MRKLRRHIAFLLFGIFFFPIVFQSFHIAWHHPKNSKEEHNHCSQPIVKKHIHSIEKNAPQKQKTCPICEYQFSVNDLTKIHFLKTELPVIAYKYIEIAKQPPFKHVFSDKAPRAPPVLSS